MANKNNNIDFEKEFENFEENLNNTESEDNIQNKNIMPDFEAENIDTECECCSKEPSKEEFYLNLAQRVQAEFDNYRKRTRQEAIDAKEKGKIDAVLELLPIADSIDNAKKIALSEDSQDAINIIEKQLYQCFDKLGVKKMNSLGANFDANYHNAILVGKDETLEEDSVMQVFQEGFTMHDKVIRYAMVQVNKR